MSEPLIKDTEHIQLGRVLVDTRCAYTLDKFEEGSYGLLFEEVDPFFDDNRFTFVSLDVVDDLLEDLMEFDFRRSNPCTTISKAILYSTVNRDDWVCLVCEEDMNEGEECVEFADHSPGYRTTGTCCHTDCLNVVIKAMSYLIYDNNSRIISNII